MLAEINFDGLVGPSHNYAGLSPGNLAATSNAGNASHPRAAALQGLAKMRANVRLGLAQGILLPPPRPDHRWLESLSTTYAEAPPHLQAQALSASSMWAANAATVSPAPDTIDGRCHLTVANLVTMPHRSHEWRDTLAQLRAIFADEAFAVHAPIPASFGDEGAANHMRLAADHAAPGVEVFVYGIGGGSFPARQHREASEAVARAHRLDPTATLFVEQNPEAIAAGAFHNDVVAVANGLVLFAHEQAFADKARFYADLRARLPEVEIVEVPAARVSLADAVSSYLFNAQLVTLPDATTALVLPGEARDNPRVWGCAQLVTLPDATTALVLPGEARDNPRVWGWLQEHVAGNGPIRRLEVVDVRESMANGGGPACLRLRVVADPATIDPRFLVDEAKLDMLGALIEQHWPETIEADAIADPALIGAIERAHQALIEAMDCVGLFDS